MKNLLKKYYELDEESKEILPFLYMYHELLSSKDDYDNINIESMADEDILMQTIINCWYNTNLDAVNIVEKLLSILNCQDITIKDLENLDLDELQELMSDDEQPTEESSILAEFVCGIYYCVLLKNHEQYLLVLNNDENSDVIVFNKLEDIFKPLINKHLLDKFLYGKPNNNADTNL